MVKEPLQSEDKLRRRLHLYRRQQRDVRERVAPYHVI